MYNGPKYVVVSAEVVAEDNYGEAHRFTAYGDDVRTIQQAIAAVERAEFRLLKTIDSVRFG